MASHTGAIGKADSYLGRRGLASQESRIVRRKSIFVVLSEVCGRVTHAANKDDCSHSFDKILQFDELSSSKRSLLGTELDHYWMILDSVRVDSNVDDRL